MAKLSWGVTGVILPIITPFHEDLSIDWDGLATLIEYYVEDLGCDGVVPCGTTGESPTLSHEEHAQVIRFVTERVGRRVPVIAGTGSNSTREAISLSRAAKEVGVDATLQVCPYYNKPTQDGLYRHFAAIATEVDLPMILYNIPGRTGRNIDPDTILRLWRDVPQVIGLKDASNDLHQAMTVLRSTDRDTFQVYSGEDVMTFSLLTLGAAGAIAAVAHVIGREVKAMCDAVWSGDLAQAKELHFSVMPLIDALFVEPNPIPVKQALTWMGLPAGPLRPPLQSMSPAAQPVLRTAMEEGGWLPPPG